MQMTAPRSNATGMRERRFCQTLAGLAAMVSCLTTGLLAQATDSTRKDSLHAGRLAAIVVTATRASRSTFETPMPVSVLSRTDFSERAPNSATTLFRDLPGLDVQGVGTNQVRPTIRGQRGQRILLLEDGVRINNSRRQQDFGELPSLVSVNDLERVEVVRGPASVLYGSDAIGGVVNLITRDARASLDAAIHGSASVLYSSADRQRRGSLTLEQRLGSFSVRLSGTGRAADPYAAPRGSYGDITLAESQKVMDSGVDDSSLSGLLNYAINSTSSLTARYEGYRARDAGFGFVDPAVLGEFEPLIRITYPDQDVHRISLRYRADALNFLFADRLEVTGYSVSNARHLGLDIFIPFGPGTPPGAGVSVQALNFTDVGTIGTRVELRKRLGRHELTYGVDAFRDRTVNTDSSTTAVVGFGPSDPEINKLPQVPNASLTSFGAFAQGDLRVSSPLSIVAGARVQEVSAAPRAGAVPSASSMRSSDGTAVGSVNAIYQIGNNVSIIASVGRAFRAPNLVERFFEGVTPEGSGYQRANPSLSPETSLNVDGGLRVRHGTLELEGFLFQNSVRDGIRTTATGDTVLGQPEYQNVNVDHLRFTGFEVEGSYRFGSALSVSASYSQIRSRNEEAPAVPVGSSYSSKSVGGVTWRHPAGRVWASYTVRHNGRVEGDQIQGGLVGEFMPAFTVQTMRAGVRLFDGKALRGSIVAAIENLGNVLYAESSNASFFRPEPRRNLLVSWVIDF